MSPITTPILHSNCLGDRMVGVHRRGGGAGEICCGWLGTWARETYRAMYTHLRRRRSLGSGRPDRPPTRDSNAGVPRDGAGRIRTADLLSAMRVAQRSDLAWQGGIRRLVNQAVVVGLLPIARDYCGFGHQSTAGAQSLIALISSPWSAPVRVRLEVCRCRPLFIDIRTNGEGRHRETPLIRCRQTRIRA